MFWVGAATRERPPRHVGVIDPEIGCQKDARPTVNAVSADGATPLHLFGFVDGLPSIVAYIEYAEYDRYGCSKELMTPP